MVVGPGDYAVAPGPFSRFSFFPALATPCYVLKARSGQERSGRRGSDMRRRRNE